jgi:hypothetical protein
MTGAYLHPDATRQHAVKVFTPELRSHTRI